MTTTVAVDGKLGLYKVCTVWMMPEIDRCAEYTHARVRHDFRSVIHPDSTETYDNNYSHHTMGGTTFYVRADEIVQTSTLPPM